MKWSITSTCYSNIIKTLELEWSRCHNNDWYNWIWANRFDKLLVGILSKLNGNTTENKFKFSKNTPPPFPKKTPQNIDPSCKLQIPWIYFLEKQGSFCMFCQDDSIDDVILKIINSFLQKDIFGNCFVRLFVKHTFKYWFYLVFLIIFSWLFGILAVWRGWVLLVPVIIEVRTQLYCVTA